jgi:hypothetical protein
MIMADVLTWFLIILGSLLVLGANWIGAFALFPGLVERSAQRYGRRPVAATVLGLVIGVPVVVFGLVAAKAIGHPLVGVLIVGALMIPLLLALAGSAGLALRIGAGMPAPIDASQPWRRVLRGSVVLGLTFLMPILGWFVLLPWALISGLGAALMALRDRSAPAPGVVSALVPAKLATEPGVTAATLVP